MFALRVEYLTGRAVATAYNDRSVAEWPPHPARLYSALVDAWADAEPPEAAEREALEWLADQPAPSLHVTPASPRGARPARPGDRVVPVPHFVPVNDGSLVGDFEKEHARLAEAEAALAGAEGKARAKAERERDKLLAKLEEAIRTAVAPAKSTPAARAQALRVLPEGRPRQARTFPSVTPESPVVWFCWEAEPTDGHRAALDALARRVVRVGHSSSLVACVAARGAPDPTLLPDPDGPEVLRVPAPGQLGRLVEAWRRHQGVEPRVLPKRFERYRGGRSAVTPEPPRPALAGEWLVLRRLAGPRLPLTRGVDVAQAVRGALLRFAEPPVPELLTGHAADGSPSHRPHLAVVPLPNVGHPHADGALLGVALLVPSGVDPASRRALLRALGRWEAEARSGDEPGETPPVPVLLGRAGKLLLERVAWGEPPTAGLRAETWSRPARVWASATPVALDRNPGALGDPEPDRAGRAWAAVEATVRVACARAGLPEPSGVSASLAPLLPGSAPAGDWPPFPSAAGKHRRVKVHVRLEFAQPVAGPLLLGAGRYYGLGLFRPLPDEVPR